MPPFRYPQFCALARAAEILCERWNLLIIRELLFGPQRFSDLRRGLGEVSPSVLTQRLATLEAAGVIRKTVLKPPAASTVYELAEAGRELLPAIRELGRWGARFLMPAEPGEQPAATMIGFYLRMLASEVATPTVRINIVCLDGATVCRCHIVGGENGTSVIDGHADAQATVSGNAHDILAVAGGHCDAAQAVREGRLSVEGDDDAVLQIPNLFRAYFPAAAEGLNSLPDQQH